MSNNINIIVRCQLGALHEVVMSLTEKILDIKLRLMRELFGDADREREIVLKHGDIILGNERELREFDLGNETVLDLMVVPQPILLCPGCDEGFSLDKDCRNYPKLLQCGHAVCLGCIPGPNDDKADEEDLSEKTEDNVVCFTCPVDGCGKPSYLLKDEAVKNHEAKIKLLERLTEERDRVEELKNALEVSKLLMWSSHHGEQCRLYCCNGSTSTSSIDELTDHCHSFVRNKRVCKEGAHQIHSLMTVAKAAEEMRNGIDDKVRSLLDLEKELISVSDEMRKRMEDIAVASTVSITQVNEKYEELIQLLIAKRDETVGQLRKDRHDREVSCIESLNKLSVTLSEVMVEREGLEMCVKGGVGVMELDDVSALKATVNPLKIGDWQCAVRDVTSVSIPSSTPCALIEKDRNEKIMTQLWHELMGGPAAPKCVSVSEVSRKDAVIRWNPIVRYHVQLRMVDPAQEAVEWSEGEEDIYCGSDLECVASGLIPNRQYEVRVCGENVHFSKEDNEDSEAGSEFSCRGSWSALQFVKSFDVNVFSSFTWNKETMSPNLLFDTSNQLIVRCNGTNQWGTALATTGIAIRSNAGYVGYFEVVMSNSSGSIGLSETAAPLQSYLGRFGVSFGWYANGSCLSALGALANHPSDKVFKAGDVVGILVDCRGEPSMSWYVNKKRVYDYLLPFSVRNKTLYPGVSLHDAFSTATVVENPEIPSQ